LILAEKWCIQELWIEVSLNVQDSVRRTNVQVISNPKLSVKCELMDSL